MKNLNSMLEWYPLIEKVVSTPKTVMIPLQEIEDLDTFISPAYDNEVKNTEMKRLVDKAEKASQSLGGYPIFLRSDQTSNKHDWNNTCYVTNNQSLAAAIARIFEFSLMVDIGFKAVILREFLTLPHEFHAFNGMPVSKEFRFFIKNGEVQCRHPYWFPSCMRRVDDNNWLPKLRKLQELDPTTQNLLDEISMKVSKAVESLQTPNNYWSIDFCYAEKIGWLVTDMAIGEDSYHYGTCPNANPMFLKRYGDPEDIKNVTIKKTK